MIAFKDIGTFLNSAEAKNIRIFDMHKNRVLDISEPTAAAAINKLQEVAPMLSMYGKIVVKGGDDSDLAQNFSRSASWTVYFENNSVTTSWSNPGQQQMQMSQGMNMQLLNTMVELEKIKVQMVADKEKRELEEKYKKKDGLPIPMEYMPFVGELLGWSDEKMFKKLQMASMAGNLSGLGQMVQQHNSSTPANTSQLHFQGTKEEKEKMMEKLWDSIGNKVDGEKMFTLLQAIDKKPEFADMAVQFVKAQGLAGPPAEEKKEVEPDYSAAPMFNYNDEIF